MKNTYAAPTVADRGDVAHTTRTGKPLYGPELFCTRGPAFGNNLSFGL